MPETAERPKRSRKQAADKPSEAESGKDQALEVEEEEITPKEAAVVRKTRGKAQKPKQVEEDSDGEGKFSKLQRANLFLTENFSEVAEKPTTSRTRKAGKPKVEPVDTSKPSSTAEIEQTATFLRPTRSKRGVTPAISEASEDSTPLPVKKSKKVTIVTPATQAAETAAAEKPSRLRKRINSAIEEEPVAKRPTRSRR